MIVPMTKYDFVLFYAEKDKFLEQLQELGLVDITTKGWEPDERERDIMLSIDRHRQAVARLKSMIAEGIVTPSEPFTSGSEAYERYTSTITELDALDARISQIEKDAAELEVWGDFDPDKIKQLALNGIRLRFFTSYTKEYEKNFSLWSEEYSLTALNEINGNTYFVVVSDDPEAEISINAQELKAPTDTYLNKYAEAGKLAEGRKELLSTLARCAASIDLIEEDGQNQKESLHLSQVYNTVQQEAEGSLLVMEGWATRETQEKVDAFLEEYPNMLYIKSMPTPEDEAPVLLKNNRFARLFEFIGNFYSLPQYGSMDLTPYFAPFYMIFFGFCLADAGYGLLLLAGGVYLALKNTGIMQTIGKLSIWCGGATIVFGFLMGSFFGIQLGELAPFEGMKDRFLNEDNLFALALGLGVFQLLFAMVLKVVNYTRQFGFKYAVSTLGWIIVIVSTLFAYFSPELGISGFEMFSIPHLIVMGIGLFMMLFLNSPGKNPFVNLGSGLWNTYNDVTGILGDVLSYIRLFAIGLSGGILAKVFNDLALGLSPDIPVLKQVIALAILLVGHGINMFMSTLSSFVHPMRLTFVEFYKNAGFEATQRAFTPLKKNVNNK